jgi:hypothetical protein
MPHIEAIFAAASGLLRTLDSPGIGRFLRDWPEPPLQRRPMVPKDLPVLSVLPTVVRQVPPRAGDLVRTLADNAVSCAWGQTYDADDFGAAFLRNYGWMELIGTRGAIVSDRLAAGFLLLGPSTCYPRHYHDAEEIYVPLSGTACWLRGEDRRPHAPLSVIHHPSRIPHGTETGSEPCLAFYLWRGGNLRQKSRVV